MGEKEKDRLIGDIVLSNSVMVISESCFENRTRITGIFIKGTEEIKENAFTNSGITSVVFDQLSNWILTKTLEDGSIETITITDETHFYYNIFTLVHQRCFAGPK